MEKGFKAFIPAGGHTPPISILAVKLEWKKAQNTLKKAKVSLIINNIKPITKPLCTCFV
jgi:hypothetical protein